MTEGKFTSATCISTPYYNQEWIQYYEDSRHPQPDIIFLDKKLIATIERFKEYDFGKYLIEKYQIKDSDFVEENRFFIVRLENK